MEALGRNRHRIEALGAGQIDAQLGAVSLRLAADAEDMQSVARLRAVRFRGNLSVGDLDRFDPLCSHLLVLRTSDATPLGTARFRVLSSEDEIRTCYSAQFYDLSALAESGLRLMEIGRICMRAGHAQETDIPRALLAGLTRAAQAMQADLLMGCASFDGASPEDHIAAMRYLRARHVGPGALRPAKGPYETFDLDTITDPAQPEDQRHVPALLRLYLAMGGWVSDHAVCDRDLDTLHVFTAVEVRAIPPARLRALQMLAQG